MNQLPENAKNLVNKAIETGHHFTAMKMAQEVAKNSRRNECHDWHKYADYLRCLANNGEVRVIGIDQDGLTVYGK